MGVWGSRWRLVELLEVSKAAPAERGRCGNGGGQAALVGAAGCALHWLARRNFSAFQPHTRAGALGYTGYKACVIDLPLSAPAPATTTAAQPFAFEEFYLWRLKHGIKLRVAFCTDSRNRYL